jgi:uncharacterized iron-regulated membrane protein
LTIKKAVHLLRNYRKWHKFIGLSLVFFILVSSLTGILLSWKKEFDILQPPTQKGAAKSLNDWLPVEEIASLSLNAFQSKHPESNPTIDRIDVRPSKGIAKVLLENGYWEIQIDGQSGEVYSIERRHSDWIEQLHDGSIIADWFKWLSMNYLGFGLIVMIITGTWLWWGPKRIRNLKLKS